MAKLTAVHKRLSDSAGREADWKNWGPYLSDRAWGTVREDYSPTGEAWDYFPHDHARSRAYRWNEDGIGGVCNRFQNLCLSVALWNEKDPILKERFFGLTGSEGNHGEDVKEYYFYLDNTPDHSYMKMLYKYQQVEYPYNALLQENRQRGRAGAEFELYDALQDSFDQNRYFDVFIEYAKGDQEDILCRITAINRGTEPASIHILPHLWYRNTWAWGHNPERPSITAVDETSAHTQHRHLGERWWYVDGGRGTALLFTENDTNVQRLFGVENSSPYVKDSINDCVIHGQRDRVNPAQTGTISAAHCAAVLNPGEEFVVKVRFTNQAQAQPFADFESIFQQRITEADEFYAEIHSPALNEDERSVQRQAFAGLLWSKQFYHYAIDLWLKGDPGNPSPDASRLHGRNSDWGHLYNLDVISMPDKWEYPWFAAWDLAFHCIPLAMVDPEWSKRQLVLMLREWYMHPNGQLAAYEWAFGDVNPPVHAWAALRVYKITGGDDIEFLEKIFHKLLLNFTWWVNRKDRNGKNVFEGGFLGLDNIGVFDRSAPLPTGGHIDQADGTAWMAMYCLNMLAIALELAHSKPGYEDIATKFFEHFVYIGQAIFDMGGGLWDEVDEFFYDVLAYPNGDRTPLRVHSFVGLIPLFAVETIDASTLANLPHFRKRMEWFLKYRPHLVERLCSFDQPGVDGRRLLSLVSQKRLGAILQKMLDETEFLSDYGLRSISRFHLDHPYEFHLDNGQVNRVQYEPAESSSGLFGGNSNWRGPIWFPVNYLMIESLRKFQTYFGDSFKVEMPSGSGQWMTLGEVADELSRRLSSIFLRDEYGHRPVFGGVEIFQQHPGWRDNVLFYEYFHGDNGAGIGASHQTGWTALVASLLQSK